MSDKIASRPDSADPIAEIRDKLAFLTAQYQLFFDDLDDGINRFLGESLILVDYTVATVPDVSTNKRGLIFVTDETGGVVPAFSDGTSWRRCTDRNIIS